MVKKPKKPEAIPIEWLFGQNGFARNLKIEIRGNPDGPFLEAVLPMLVDSAARSWERREGQRRKSSQPRPKKNDDDKSRDDVIETIVRSHPGEGPSELWVRFKDALAEWSRDDICETGEGDSRSYQYEIGEGKRQRIGFRAFRQKVRAYRKKAGV